MAARIPMILDVDTGIDDSLAILYACASPEVDLIALTCVGGNVPTRQVAVNTRSLLELVGRADVPVALGTDRPLAKPLATAEDTHGPRGIGYAELAAPTHDLASRDAASWIADAARGRPGTIHLVTLGPMTNLALALELEPRLPSLLGAWTFMAGAFWAPGNTTPVAEWNVHVDPDAARRCLAGWAAAIEADPRTPLPLGLGLDVTERARLVPGDVARIARRAGAAALDAAALADGDPRMVPAGSVASDPVLRFIADALRFYFEFHDRNDGFYGAFIHDPFAVAAAIDRGLAATRPAFVDVETGPGLGHGMTVADVRGLTGRTANVEVAIDGSIDAFLDRLVERIGGLAAAVRRPEVGASRDARDARLGTRRDAR